MNQRKALMTTTANGDSCYRTTLDTAVDLFGMVGASRQKPGQVLPSFQRLCTEDLKMAMAFLFYTRDIRHGLGERVVFRRMLNAFGRRFPEIGKAMIPFIPEYGRYDDLFAFCQTPVEKPLFEYLKKLFLNAMKNPESVSPLFAKWMPSINCHSKTSRLLARRLAHTLGFDERTYRKALVSLRQGKIIENYLREMDYSFDYAHVPSQAMHKYRQAFERNDGYRYSAYLEDVAVGKKKIHAGTLFPYEIVSEYSENMDEVSKLAMENKWQAMKGGLKGDLKNTIVVRDGSGSMRGYPDQVATSLAILFSEYLEGPFKNSFITFSHKPRLITIPRHSLYDKLEFLHHFDDYTNTDIFRVYKLIANLEHQLPKEQCVERILIISDMEFDAAEMELPTYDVFLRLFKKADLPVPQVIFLNVHAFGIHFAATKDNQVQLLSGASKSLVDLLTRGKDFTPRDLVEEAVTPYYPVVDKILEASHHV